MINSQLQDTIEKDLTIKADRDKVWALVSEPREMERWFCDEVQGGLQLNEDCVLVWHKYGKGRIRVVIVDPKDRFGYRWIPGGDDESAPLTDENTTLVLFTLSDSPEGTKVNMVESGFASLPAEMREKALRDNTEGWESELAEMAALYQ